MKNRISRNYRNVPTRKKQRPLFSLVGIFLIPALLFSLLIAFLPSNWIPFDLWIDSDKTVSFIPETDSTAVEKYPLTESRHPEYRDLLIKKTFWKNRLAMADEDSVSMTINFNDSLITLELKGVVLYSCKMQRFDLNVDIKDLKKHPNLLEWLDSPFTMVRDSSSIPKVPLKIIQAPKDSVEAQYVINQILNGEEEPDIRYSLHFSRNLRIDISQFQLEKIPEKQYSNLFYLDDKSMDFLGKVFSPKNIPVPSEELRIAIYLSQSDAKTIYRATPRHPYLAVCF